MGLSNQETLKKEKSGVDIHAEEGPSKRD